MEGRVRGSCLLVRSLSPQVTRMHSNSNDSNNNKDPARTLPRHLASAVCRSCSQHSTHTISFDLCKALGGAAATALTSQRRKVTFRALKSGASDLTATK